MAKIGKYAKGFTNGQPKSAPSPYGMSNQGYGARQNMMDAMMTKEPRQVPRKRITGTAPDPSEIRPRSTFKS